MVRNGEKLLWHSFIVWRCFVTTKPTLKSLLVKCFFKGQCNYPSMPSSALPTSKKFHTKNANKPMHGGRFGGWCVDVFFNWIILMCEFQSVMLSISSRIAKQKDPFVITCFEYRKTKQSQIKPKPKPKPPKKEPSNKYKRIVNGKWMSESECSWLFSFQ